MTGLPIIWDTIMFIIDSHLHLDIIDNVEVWAYLRDNIGAAVIWSFDDRRPQTFADLAAYYNRQQDFVKASTTQGLKCVRLAGIHPRNIPGDIHNLEEQVFELLLAQLNCGDVAGIGEIGLEKATGTEKEVLAMQIMFAVEHYCKICVHTPRKNKAEILPQMLAIIAASGINPEYVLVDHLADSAMVETVLDLGYHAGITISPAKSGPAQVLTMLEANTGRIDRIMLNSDLAVASVDDYRMFVETVQALPPEFKPAAAQTAADFFKIRLPHA